MRLEEITPMILTFNEQDNLRRTLSALAWAKQIVVVDSFSTDQTLDIAAAFPSVRVVQRKFDHFADQCNFGLSHVKTEWVLSLDADYICNAGLFEELRSLVESSAAGYWSNFRYGIYGKALRGSLYPPRIVLYRRDSARYQRDGHAHRVVVEGPLGKLTSFILHDDRKPLGRWVNSQLKYAELEAAKLESTPRNQLGWKDRLRTRYVITPFLTVLYCLFYKGLILDGWAGIFYTFQRIFAELTLSLTLLDRKLRNRNAARENANAETTKSGNRS
jgi:glycosyltransferase involved in cell wall biosynthesis